jgi:hypothetical protein
MWGEMDDDISSICEEIRALPVNNVRDLALLARAVALSARLKWIGDEDDADGVMPFVEAVCKLAGVEAMPGCREIREGRAE